jgi:hypothetical protein
MSQTDYHLTIPPVNRIEPGFRDRRSAAEPQPKLGNRDSPQRRRVHREMLLIKKLSELSVLRVSAVTFQFHRSLRTISAIAVQSSEYF